MRFLLIAFLGLGAILIGAIAQLPVLARCGPSAEEDGILRISLAALLAFSGLSAGALFIRLHATSDRP